MLRRVSLSPFSDVGICAPQVRDRAIFSFKPRPTNVVGNIQPEKIRAYLVDALKICRENHCVTEVILKDTHSVDGHPERFDRWSEIAFDARQQVYG